MGSAVVRLCRACVIVVVGIVGSSSAVIIGSSSAVIIGLSSAVIIGSSSAFADYSYGPAPVTAPRIPTISLLGAVDRSSPNVAYGSGANASFSSGTGFSIGADYGRPWTEKFDLHVGAMYSLRYWQDSAYGSQRLGLIEVPAYVEFLAHRFFVIDAGLYYSAMNVGTRVGYLSDSDIGVMGGVKIFVPVSKKARAFIGANYLYGLYNVSEVGGSLGMHDIQVVFGVRFSLSSGAAAAKKSGPVR